MKFKISRSRKQTHEEKIAPYKNFGMKEHVFFELKMNPPKNYLYYRAWNIENIQNDLIKYRITSNDPNRFNIGGAHIKGNPIEGKSLYNKEANWIKPMWDIIPGGLEKVEINGVYHHENNKNGMVRDHKYSRRSGYSAGVFPEILRHPANCDIITGKENLKKSRNNSHTVYELMEKIVDYDKPWVEQKIVLSKIEKYLNGDRWQHKVIIPNFLSDIIPDLYEEEVYEYSPGLLCLIGEPILNYV